MAVNPSLERNPDLDDWLSIGADGRITLRNGKVDIGQRISTAVALLVADELDVAPGRIDVVRAETGLSPDEGITSGSLSMADSATAVRLAAATARAHLLASAADMLAVDPATLDVADGQIRARTTNRTTSYQELAGGRPFGIPVDSNATVKAPAELRHVGRPAIARGMREIVTGKPHFVQDMTLPGMVHARVIRPPHYHARLRGLDEAVAGRLADDGVQVVRDGSFLAVAAADEFAAVRAAGHIAPVARWDLGDGLEPQDVFERLTRNARVSLPVVNGVPQDAPAPEPAPAPADAAVALAARYERPYQMHGSIGPSAAFALFEHGRLSIWTHSQGPYVLRASLSEALGMDPDSVRIAHVPGAGCYGHNGADDAAVDAALIARALPGTPVLLKWSRADEHAWEPYGTCMVMELAASLDSRGRVVAWSHESFGDTYSMRPRPGPGGAGPARLLAMRHVAEARPAPVAQPAMARHMGIHRNLEPLYDFPEPRLVKHLVRNLPLRTSALRGLGAYANVFAIESFMDELALAAGKDRVAFRLDHLRDDRARAVLAAVGERLRPAGGGSGLAFARYKNIAAYAAVGIELEVTDAAEIRLLRAVIAADAGQVVDPDGLTAQLEGGLIQAASWTLHEEVTFDRTGITSRDWETYPILRFDNVPEIETILIDRPDAPFLGAGEATAGPTAAAIANAVRDATGLSLRRLPFTPDAVRRAAMA